MKSTADHDDASVPAGVLAYVNGVAIDQAEFDYQYDKSATGINAASPEEVEAKKDFLSRYVDFKVKVLEAREAGYSDNPELQAEIEQYRTQLARPFLMERNVFEPLVREMYTRRAEAVDASHLLITVSADASPADTLAAFARISSLRDSVMAGKDFGDLAAAYSMDPSAKGPAGAPGSRGSLGYFGGGRMVESFENKAFNTPVGSVSPVFRSQFGYHILKVNDRMPMPADRLLAHIMIRPRGQSAADVADADQRLSRAQTQLANGVDFAEVAKELSDDQQSATNGGQLGMMSYDAGLPFSFRDAGFGLTEVGSYVGPVQTAFGYHFIKLIELAKPQSYEEQYEVLKGQVNRLPRAAAAEKAFAAQLRDSIGFTIDMDLIKDWSASFTADSLFRLLSQSSYPQTDSLHEMMTLGSQSFTVSDYSNYLSSNKLPDVTSLEKRLLAVAENFLGEKAILYQIEQLEGQDNEFSRTMRDFRDGLILFKLMEDSVWTAASMDSVGMRVYFDKNKAQFTYPDRVKVITYSAVSDSLIASVVSTYRDVSPNEGHAWAIQVPNKAIRIDTTFVEAPSGSIYDRVFEMNMGDISDSIPYNRGFIALTHAGLDPARPMEFAEARASLLSQYQSEVERRLLERLRNKYKVRTFPSRLGTNN